VKKRKKNPDFDDLVQPPRKTSQIAGASFNKAIARFKVFRHIQAQGKKGSTCDEAEAALGMSHQTASPRVFELHVSGRIVDSDQRRHTRSGRKAIVWIAMEAPEGPEQEDWDR